MQQYEHHYAAAAARACVRRTGPYITVRTHTSTPRSRFGNRQSDFNDLSPLSCRKGITTRIKKTICYSSRISFIRPSETRWTLPNRPIQRVLLARAVRAGWTRHDGWLLAGVFTGRVGGKGDPTQPDPREFQNLLTPPDPAGPDP